MQIENHVLHFGKNSKSKCGTFDYLDHQPGGGNVQVYSLSLLFYIRYMKMWYDNEKICLRCLVATTIYGSRQLRPLVKSMSSDAVKTLVQAFISCRLDYCNSMFYGITDDLMSRLQSVQNADAAVRLVSCARRCDHNAGATGAALASGSASRGFQDGHFGTIFGTIFGSSKTNWRLLKTFLFGCWKRGALWLTVKLRP